MIWTGHRARRANTTGAVAAVSAVAIGCGTGLCAWSESPAPTQATVVSGTLNAPLSMTPGTRASSTSGGGLSLAVEERSRGGVLWHRVLTSDGKFGWTDAHTMPLGSASVKAAVSPFSLMSSSPDEPAYEENAHEIPVSIAGAGVILGATSRPRVASVRDLMTPSRLQRALWPWLRVQFDSATGYSPLDWLTLSWPADSNSGSLDASLEAAGIRGLVWRPFLGPFSRTLMQLAPKAGSYAIQISGTETAAPRTQLTENWDGIDAVYRDGAGVLLVIASRSGHLFRFMNEGSVGADLFIAGTDAYPLRIVLQDLNGDGSRDWVLEVCAINGDGYVSMLWVVDGASRPDHPKLSRLPLSGASGEDGVRVNRDWSIAKSGIVRVMEQHRNTQTVASYRYTDKLIPVTK
jgi:hypothetical protein